MVAISPAIRVQRLISPWEYRHLRAFGVTRVAGASVATAAGIVCLSYGVYGWAAFLPGRWGAESHGGLLVPHHRSLPIFPHVTPRGYSPLAEEDVAAEAFTYPPM